MKPDIMDQLAAARPEDLDPADDPHRRQSQLNAAFAQPLDRRSTMPRAIKRAGIGFGVATGLAAVAAVAILATNTVPAAPPARSTAVPHPAVVLSAQEVLLGAAQQSTKLATSGRYWLTTTVIANATSVGNTPNLYVMMVKDRSGEWLARTKGDDNWSSYVSRVGISPASPADAAAWKRAGSPTTLTAHLEGRKDYKVTFTPGAPYISKQGKSGDAVRAIGATNITINQMLAMPTTAAALKAYLLNIFHKPGNSGSDMPTKENEWLYGYASSLLWYPVRPATRVAAYQILASLPGVRSLGTVTDLNGRSGPAVALTTKDAGGSRESRLIISPTTGLPLASEIRQLSGGTFAPGTMISSELVEFAGWTNTHP
jgi:hypothetical protein